MFIASACTFQRFPACPGIFWRFPAVPGAPQSADQQQNSTGARSKAPQSASKRCLVCSGTLPAFLHVGNCPACQTTQKSGTAPDKRLKGF
eukprot:6906462-Alexandrium_andersonii.AAC.1